MSMQHIIYKQAPECAGCINTNTAICGVYPFKCKHEKDDDRE